MHDALLIARREYLERVRSKAFLFTTVVLPILMGILLGGSMLSTVRSASSTRNIVIASDDSRLAEDVKAELASKTGADFNAVVLGPLSAEQHDSLRRAVEEKEYDGILWIDTGAGRKPLRAVYESRSAGDLFTGDRLQNAVSRALTRLQLANQGVSQDKIDQLMTPVHLEVDQIKGGKTSPSNASSRFIGAYIMIFLLYFSVIYYGMNVARSVIQEKTSRVFEVLLSATRPESLMAGKLIGVGAAGLTQIAIWLGAALLYGGSAASVVRAGGLRTMGISLTEISFFVLFFLLGFLFYSALSAAFGASASTEQEIQQFGFLIVLPMIVGLVLMTYILANPNAPAVVALSLFPPCTPVVMYLRMAAQTPPLWQLLLSIALMVAAIWAMLWIASRIYRVGILMYGKRATLPEIVRWLRYS